MSELEGTKHGALHNSREAFAYAAEQGVDVRYPMANELFIDIDDEKGMYHFNENYTLIEGTTGCTMTPSRRKPEGKHIVVTLSRNVTPVERIALQAALGSDPRREAHSLRRYFNGDPLPTLFFEKRT
jgi:hypothetical protein